MNELINRYTSIWAPHCGTGFVAFRYITNVSPVTLLGFDMAVAVAESGSGLTVDGSFALRPSLGCNAALAGEGASLRKSRSPES